MPRFIMATATTPCHTISEATPTEDLTVVEFMDPKMMVIRQMGEEGRAHSICLSPEQVIKIGKLLDGYLFFPNGIASLDTPQQSLSAAA